MAISSLFLLSSCEEPLVVDVPPAENQLVVEGSIENGRPPFLLLTYNSSIYEGFDSSSLQSLFVHDAKVRVIDEGNWSVDLVEWSSDTLPEPLRMLLQESLGSYFQPGTELFFYTIRPQDAFAIGQAGHRYRMEIETPTGNAHAVTTIPEPVPIDSFRFERSPEDSSLYQMLIHVSDPDTAGNYYRYFTRRMGEPWYAPVSSVVDDRYFNGQSFWTPLPAGEPLDSAIYTDFGLVRGGEVVWVRWCSIDRPHFQFWRSAEFQSVSRANPFSSVIRINGNVEGALGIWGGYGSTTYTKKVE